VKTRNPATKQIRTIEVSADSTKCFIWYWRRNYSSAFQHPASKSQPVGVLEWITGWKEKRPNTLGSLYCLQLTPSSPNILRGLSKITPKSTT